ncbi:MAG TPA: hypothetical protein VFM18_05635 [Methanosarcina sp.]|nr:hypothetical protein [Methanosarcina sp.]
MTTTYVDFTPSPLVNFRFQAILDTVPYNVVVTYNVFGKRYYVNIYTVQGDLVMTRPMVGSPPGYDISLTAGMFTSTLVYRIGHQQFEISDIPLTYPDFGTFSGYMLDANLQPFVLNQSMLA